MPAFVPVELFDGEFNCDDEVVMYHVGPGRTRQTLRNIEQFVREESDESVFSTVVIDRFGNVEGWLNDDSEVLPERCD